MAFLDKRVGLSYISDTSSIDTLYNEEIVVDKTTGEILVKTPQLGNVISYNYHTRFNNHIDRLVNMSFEHTIMSWDILQLSLDNVVFPNVDSIIGKELITEPFKLGMGVNQLVLSIDIDRLHTKDLSLPTKAYDTMVQYEIVSEYLGVVREVYSGIMSVQDINSHVFNFQKNDNINIQKLIIGTDSDIGVGFRNITHSILVGVSRNGLYPLSSIRVISEAVNEQMIDKAFDDTGLIIGGIIAHSGDIRILDPEDYSYTISPVGGE